MKLKIKIFARNIVNPEAITEFVIKVSKGQSDKIKTWCNTILKNYLKNEYDNLKEITKVKKTDPVWLQEAVKRKDAQEIIIKKDFERLLIEHIFHYFDTLQSSNIKHTFSEADKQTKEWENKENLFNIKLTKGVKEILKCAGGYTWFEIIDKETLYNEGEIIQNCLRKKEHGPKYWKQIKNKEIKIFTLRDSKGIGHVAVEYNISINSIEQMNGKQNKPPIKIYHPFCMELLKYLEIKINVYIKQLLNIIVINNKSYYIDDLPDTLVTKGNLDLEFFDVSRLPNNLTVGRDLILQGTDIKELPNNLKVGKDLIISGTLIKKIPDDTIIGGNVIGNGELTELGNNLQIKGSISLFKCKIELLPKNLQVGTLYISNTKIKELPDDLKVEECIYISKNMKLKYVPKHLLNKVKIL